MATEVTLPEVLQSVQDVTINRWLVKAGDAVKTGQPILEVATDKVDTQIDSPADGTILRLNFGQGEIVNVHAVLALIGSPGEISQSQIVPAAPDRAPDEPAATMQRAVARSGARLPPQGGQSAPGDGTRDEVRATPVARRVAGEERIKLDEVTGTGATGQVTKEDVLAYAAGKQAVGGLSEASAGPAAAQNAQKAGSEAQSAPEASEHKSLEAVSLPLQRLAAEHNINLRELAGDRPLDSLTAEELLAAIASRTGQSAPTTQWTPQWATAAAPNTVAPAPGLGTALAHSVPSRLAQTPLSPGTLGREVLPAAGADEELVPHSRMRSMIARNTVQSAFTIPQVTTWWDVDMTAVIEHRRQHKASFAAEGANLTITAYLVHAAIAGLRAVPAANSSWSEEGILLKHHYHIGVAVALPQDEHGLGGLIVPVIKNAGDLSLLGLARAINDLAQRARQNQLAAVDLLGGTFSVSNYGTSGSRFQTPIITGNQAGVLGVGAIQRQPVLISQGSPLEARLDDHVAFLPILTLGFTYDHRILDGATADAYCAAVKGALEKYRYARGPIPKRRAGPRRLFHLQSAAGLLIARCQAALEGGQTLGVSVGRAYKLPTTDNSRR